MSSEYLEQKPVFLIFFKGCINVESEEGKEDTLTL